MPLAWDDVKDPDEVLDYDLDWTAALAGDVIVTSTWTAPAGITVQSDDIDGAKTIVWLAGGVLGQNYDLLNRVETAAGRIMDQTMRIRVRAR